jgi:type II secretory pathway component PulJ
MYRTERGVVLLEVLVAVMILSVAGLGLVSLVRTGLEEERDSRDRERLLAVEERLLAGLTLLRREDLDRRLGRHPLGEFVVDVQRPERALYRIVIAGQRAPEVEELVTVLFRPGRER